MFPSYLFEKMTTDRKTSKWRCIAMGLYDNMADAPDELAFRKGDLLTVLEQNTAGCEGWWLCSLRGRQGICPGNRLRLVAGVFDTGGPPPSPPPTPTLTPSPAPLSHRAAHHQTHQPHARRRSWNVHPTKVVVPQRVGDVYLYEQPSCAPCSSPMLHQQSTYDVPRSATSVASAASLTYDSPRSWTRSSPVSAQLTPVCPVSPARRPDQPGEWYDVPRAIAPPHVAFMNRHLLTPSSSASSLTAESVSSSNRSSLANMQDYDIPKTRGPNLLLHSLQEQQNQTYDVPPSNPQPKELPLEWSEALDMLERLQNEATSAIARLLGFVRPDWRTHASLSIQILDVRLGALRLRASLHELTEFTEGTLGNAASAHDKGLTVKLRPLVKALRDADRLVNEVIANLDSLNWSVEILSRSEEHGKSTSTHLPPDNLDQLIACARALTEDVRQTASFIQGNSTLLFKKTVSLQIKETTGVGEWVEEYDYVKLESRESVNKKHAEIRESLPKDMKRSFDNVIKDADYCPTTLQSYNMAPNDKQLITFYAAQTVTYFTYLTNAIDAFLKTVECNQPPAVFLAHGKFLVLSAHRLVYIGDSVHRNIDNTEVKARILGCSNVLSDGLAATVAKTKNAALHYPSVGEVQDMVDSVVDVSHLARDLKRYIIEVASKS